MKRLHTQLRTALAKWETFASLFPVASPAFLLGRGLTEISAGRGAKGVKSILSSVERAQQHGMLYACALGYYYLSQLDPQTGVTKKEAQEYRTQAQALFSSLKISFKTMQKRSSRTSS